MLKRSLHSLLLCGLILAFASSLPAAEITPFRITNQSPLAQIYGIPSDSSASLSGKGGGEFTLDTSLANSYSPESSRNELLKLDGESVRIAARVKYGITDSLEGSLSIPLVIYGGGFTDQFIISWHNAFGMPQNGRDINPKFRTGYNYSKDNKKKLVMDNSGVFLGDIAFGLAYSLYDKFSETGSSKLAVRGDLKLPTGDSSRLAGSGSVDTALSLAGARSVVTQYGKFACFGSIGGMFMSAGDVISDQQNSVAAFGTVGGGWQPSQYISFKIQLNAHSALYRNSSLTELSSPSFMLTSGGSLHLNKTTDIDIGVAEDVAVSTAPDVTFHIGLSKKF